VPGHRCPQSALAKKRQIAVGVVIDNGGPGRRQRAFRRSEVRVQIFQPQHVRIPGRIRRRTHGVHTDGRHLFQPF
jgi:hypothetical protein